MVVRVTWMVAAALVVWMSSVLAQDEAAQLESIEVTGSRISYRDLLDTPAVALTKRGDYLSQLVILVNDTRDADGRRKELHDTIEKLLARAGKRYQVLHGDAYAITLDRSNYRVELRDEDKREDTSRVTLRVRTELSGEAADGNQQIESLRAFIRETPKVGRTEIEMTAETALGMKRPERYRYELIEAIAADSQRIRRTMGADCRIELDGLNSRIEWERVGPVELLLYVPYSMQVVGCGGSHTP